MRVRVVIPLICLALISYFGYHLVVGNHGLNSRARYEKQIQLLEGELAGLQAVRQRLERDVSLLRAEHLDPDMLDERARAILNFAHPNDIVIVKPKSATGAAR
ncbi:MAG: septum formation initiator family protein [Hyphomicrobiales bacterium]|nr:septum formation initiator family protein [Hyphomicrobiales bacterium]